MVGFEKISAELPRSTLWFARARANTAEIPPGDQNRYPTHTTIPNQRTNPCTTSAQMTACNPPSNEDKKW